MQRPDWLGPFKISEDEYTQFEAQAQTQGRPVLEILIEAGKLNELKYLAWESGRTKLPFLKTLFFNATPPLHLWKSLNFAECRKHGVLPIAEWDGHVIWGKLTSEPTPFDKMVPRSIFLLAPCSGLVKYFSLWRENFPQDTPTPEVVIEQEMPTGLVMTNMSSEASAADLSSGLTLDAPAGLNLSITTTNNIDMPAGLISRPEPPPIHPPQAPGGSSAAAEGLTQAMKQTKNQDELADLTLSTWLKSFDKSMILLHEENKLSFWRWAGAWEAKFNVGEMIPLNTPSVFKIVVDTQQPYHGHVSPSPVNEHVFKLLLSGQYPEHITVVPVVVSGNVVVLIMGLCSKEKGKKLSLDLLSEHGKAFAENLIRFAQSQKKAG